MTPYLRATGMLRLSSRSASVTRICGVTGSMASLSSIADGTSPPYSLRPSDVDALMRPGNTDWPVTLTRS